MKSILLLSTTIALLACNQQKHSTVPQEFECFNNPCVFIKYKQPVNGYTVKVMCSPYKAYDKERDTEIWGSALLCFEKGDYEKFYIYNESYSDSILYYVNEEPVKDGVIFNLDYLPKQENEYLSQNSPFFFQDLDFDGTEELVINNWRTAIRHCNTYDVYKIDGTSTELTTTPPFYKISNYMTEFDSINRTITTADGTDINGNFVFQTYHIDKQNNQYQQTDNHSNTIPHGFEWADFSKQGYMCINIKYRQQVNDYDVSAICLVDTFYNGYEEFTYYNQTCHAFIHFQNDEHDFIVENPLFSGNFLRQNDTPLRNGLLIETDYIPFKLFNDTLNNMLYSDSESPFFFFDIDFDGKKELIINLLEGMGYHGHSAYKAYKIPTENDCIVLSPMQGEPFDNLNDYAEIDTIGKTITLPYNFGIRLGGRKKYGLVTHLFYNESTDSLEERQVMELTGIEHYSWEHTRGVKYEACEPTVYHYKKVNGDMKLVNIEKCANDK